MHPRAVRHLWVTLVVAGFALVLNRDAAAQGLEHVKAHYTKYEYKIPTRDGKRLFTAVYVPKDTSEKYPIMLTRTPYSVGPYGADRYKDHLGPSPRFGQSGYIFAYQDVRGCWMSEGEFVQMRPHIVNKAKPGDIDDSSDTHDTIQWLLDHIEGHNGKVGMWGISYPGFYTAAGSVDAHEALKAASPQAPVMDWFIGDDWHHNGAFFLPHAFNFLAQRGHPRPGPTKKEPWSFDHETPDGYEFFLRMGPLANADARYFKGDVGFWTEMMQHGVYDQFWKSRNFRMHLKQIRPAMLTVGGWFDAENLFGALETFKKIEASSPESRNHLVMGPWSHGGWTGDGFSLGDVSFNARTGEFFREQIEFPFFESILKEKGKPSIPKAWVFETGTNQWRKLDAWPPKAARPHLLYFRPAGRLASEPPTEDDAGAVDEYTSDPAKPVPYIDLVTTRMAPEYMTADQRFAGRRTDVLVYDSGVLERDVTLAGPLEAGLFVSTTGTDADWVVKLIDVYPDDYPDPSPNPRQVRMGAYQQLVRGDVMRGKFRNSYENPEPFKPDEPTAVNFTLQDIYHTFRSGHRIMVQIQSTWFPLVDRNPQRFVDIYQAKPSDFQKATQRVYRSKSRPSHVKVMVVE
jgi:putative CocE/NonD family hydrolase